MKKSLLAIFLLFISISLYSQPTETYKKSLEAIKINPGMITLDGKIDESFWSNITGIEDFLMQEPIEGGEPSEKTVIKVAYDEKFLYIGAVLYDSNPDGIKSFKMRKDSPLNTDDRFMLILDTYLDGRNAYFFEINPKGLMGDGLLTIAVSYTHLRAHET